MSTPHPPSPIVYTAYLFFLLFSRGGGRYGPAKWAGDTRSNDCHLLEFERGDAGKPIATLKIQNFCCAVFERLWGFLTLACKPKLQSECVWTEYIIKCIYIHIYITCHLRHNKKYIEVRTCSIYQGEVGNLPYSRHYDTNAWKAFWALNLPSRAKQAQYYRRLDPDI